MNDLFKRIISGSIYVILIVAAIYTIPYSPVPFLLVFGVFTVLGLWEINHLSVEGDVKSPLLSLIDVIGGVGVFLAFFLMYAGTDSRSIWLLPLLLYFIVRLSFQLYMPAVNALHSVQRSFMGVAYVAFPLGMMNSICAISHPMMLLAVFVLLWLNDSGAYVFGSLLGKHKLFERISPHKSWEGFWGGLLTSIIAALLIGNFFNHIFHGPETLWAWGGLAIVVSIFGTLGDLAESLLKRTVGVKDASNLIPGHGGILDRIDSFLMACPAVLTYLIILKLYF